MLYYHNEPTSASRVMQSVLVKHQITQGTQHPTAQIWRPSTSGFSPKLKSPLKGKRFQTFDKIQENTTGQLMVIGRIV